MSETQNHALEVSTAVLLGLAWTAGLLRFFTRLHILKFLALDDWLMFAGLVSY
jgi:hypothetical protein